MRPYQWLKNLFVLAPLLFGRKLGDTGAVGEALLACACFCLMSSSLYIVNDIVDAPEDRAHPAKRLRPIPSGALPIGIALPGSGLLMLAALWIAVGIGFQFLLLSIVYWALMMAYCFTLKRAVVLDAMTIAFGFVLRVVGGAVAVNVQPTHWLIVCAFLLALFLAFSKRRQELLKLSELAVQHRTVLGQYSVSYLDQVNNILTGATVVCYALYTVAPETIARFGSDNLIYGTIFVIYGLLRYMVLMQNPSNGADPSKMLVRDRPLLIAILGWVIYNSVIIYQPVIAGLLGRLQ
jgi:4-hydroxybenzoate polyprenyltransferase